MDARMHACTRTRARSLYLDAGLLHAYMHARACTRTPTAPTPSPRSLLPLPASPRPSYTFTRPSPTCAREARRGCVSACQFRAPWAPTVAFPRSGPPTGLRRA